MKNEKKELLGVSIDKKLKELLKQDAKKAKRSTSSHAVWIIEEHLKKEK